MNEHITEAYMRQLVKTSDPVESEWIERILFANGEDAFSERLVGLSVIGEIVGYHDTLDDVVRITRHFSARINHQLSVVDVSNPNPAGGKFVTVGNYRLRGDVESFSSVSDLPNPVQRKQVIEDYFMARTLGVPLFAKVRAKLSGVQWSYDRILVPVRTKDLNILITAFWHHAELAVK